MIWRPWTKGGSGALSEITADDEHMSVVWGRGQSSCLPPSVQIYLILSYPASLGLGEHLPQQTNRWPLLGLCHLIMCEPVPSVSRWAPLRETHNEGTDMTEGQRGQ